MALIDNLRRVTHRLLRSHPRAPARSHSDPLPPVIDPSPRQEINQDSADATVDKGVSGEKSVATMSSEELWAFENRDAASINRASDRSEAQADERQDVTTSLSFPLHWTSATESWNYLFDVSIACELLAPRPADLILDFAAGTCWATELLARVAVRTISVDLSLEMMRRGRERLGADRRLVFRDEAEFVVARGQALPFA